MSITGLRHAIWVLLLLATNLHASEIRNIRLDNGQTLIVEPISYSRTLPYAFYDQAKESFSSLYPDGEILLERRLGYLGKDPVRLISVIGYLRRPEAPQLTLRGVITEREQAWSFQADAPPGIFDETLLLSLEFLSGSAL